MVISSGLSYLINAALTRSRYSRSTEMDFEVPLTNLLRITAVVTIAVTYLVSYLLIPTLAGTNTFGGSFQP